ncbi:MAG TPA: acyl-CoA dehydrogenase family protein, partial [Myxococcota bacterium]|nr:acyl-CoA dehydrogenase family protein [Myxococcota bacterium]
MLVETTDEQDVFAAATARFLQAELPLTAVRELARSGARFDKDLWRRGAELGWMSLLVSEEHGGGSVSGDGLADLTIVADLFGRYVAPGPLTGCNVVCAALADADHDDASLLSSLVSGETSAAWCFGEPSGEPRFAHVATTAERAGGDWIVTGRKSPVDGAPDVDYYLVVAATDRGLVQLIVPADAPGLICDPLLSLDVVRKFGALTLDRVRVP